MNRRRHRSSISLAMLARCAEWRRWVACLTVVMLASTPLLASLHRASVQHFVCEHGDLVEPDEGHGEPGAPAARLLHDGAANDRGLHFAPSEASASLHDHHHCSVGSLGRSGAPLVRLAAVLAYLSRLVEYEENPAGYAHAWPVLVSAPKTSPPSVFSSILI